MGRNETESPLPHRPAVLSESLGGWGAIFSGSDCEMCEVLVLMKDHNNQQNLTVLYNDGLH